jgi:hypothetical protein
VFNVVKLLNSPRRREKPSGDFESEDYHKTGETLDYKKHQFAGHEYARHEETSRATVRKP